MGMVIYTTWMYSVYYVSCSQTALKSSLPSLYALCNSIYYSVFFLCLYVAIDVSQKSAKFLLTELSNITQVPPHAFSLLSAAGPSQTGTENHLNVCTDCSVIPTFFGYWMVIETLVIQDLQC